MATAPITKANIAIRDCFGDACRLYTTLMHSTAPIWMYVPPPKASKSPRTCEARNHRGVGSLLG